MTITHTKQKIEFHNNILILFVFRFQSNGSKFKINLFKMNYHVTLKCIPIHI